MGVPSQHTACELLLHNRPPSLRGNHHHFQTMPGVMNLESVACARCDDGFEPKAKIVNSNGELFHSSCFVCAQCFRPFPDGVFYEFEGRKYCEHDFHVLFAPCCAKCGEFIIGRVIKAMQSTWHPECFCCEMCGKELADLGFIKNQGRALCHECNAKVKAAGQGKHMCQKCHSIIDGEPLRFRGEVYHPYHFSCTNCKEELNELYCLRCHDRMGIPICGAADVRSRGGWSPHLGNIGASSTSSAPSARSLSWETATTSGKALPTVRPTTTSCLGTCAMCATKSSRPTSSPHSTRLGV